MQLNSPVVSAASRSLRSASECCYGHHFYFAFRSTSTSTMLSSSIRRNFYVRAVTKTLGTSGDTHCSRAVLWFLYRQSIFFSIIPSCQLLSSVSLTLSPTTLLFVGSETYFSRCRCIFLSHQIPAFEFTFKFQSSDLKLRSYIRYPGHIPDCTHFAT